MVLAYDILRAQDPRMSRCTVLKRHSYVESACSGIAHCSSSHDGTRKGTARHCMLQEHTVSHELTLYFRSMPDTRVEPASNCWNRPVADASVLS